MYERWATDTMVSMPVPPNTDEAVLPITAGFGYTRFGITHNLTGSDAEGYRFPTYLPFDLPERE